MASLAVYKEKAGLTEWPNNNNIKNRKKNCGEMNNYSNNNNDEMVKY